MNSCDWCSEQTVTLQNTFMVCGCLRKDLCKECSDNVVNDLECESCLKKIVAKENERARNAGF